MNYGLLSMNYGLPSMNSGLLSMNCGLLLMHSGLLEGIVACFSGLLGFPCLALDPAASLGAVEEPTSAS